ncbi:MAG: ABC transporter permease, partial [Candidatus Latescibacteria bacterium]|nr:ABC transporter permease [Candidatus Latescibacterota bacterium]
MYVNGMWMRFIGQRLLQTLPVLMGVSLIVFLTMHLTPGDPLEHMLGQAGSITQEQIDALRNHYALDRPIIVQYGLFAQNALRGDFGLSYSHHGRPVLDVIAERFPATLELTFVSLIIALILSIPAGAIASLRPHGLFDRGATVAALLGFSLPGFWLGIMLMIVFGLRLRWLPISGRIDFAFALQPITGIYTLDALLTVNSVTLWNSLKHLILPSVTMAAPMLAIVMRMVRSSMIGVLSHDYVQFARAKGVPEVIIIVKHALKNALIPTVNIV